MRVEVTTAMADARGRTFKPGRAYDMDDAEAHRLVNAGFAKVTATDASMTVDLLEKLGGGLVVTKTTAPALVAAAKAKRLVVKRVRGVLEEATNGGDGS